jgi:hypothetical protein
MKMQQPTVQECRNLGWDVAWDVAEGLYREEELFPDFLLQCGNAENRLAFLCVFRESLQVARAAVARRNQNQ